MPARPIDSPQDKFEAGSLHDGAECVLHVAETIEETGADIHTDPVLHSACAVDLSKGRLGGSNSLIAFMCLTSSTDYYTE